MDENLSHDEAQVRFKESVNMMHLGEVPHEMADKRPESFACGNVGSMTCAAPRSQRFPVRRWLMDTGCGHDLIGHREVLAQNCPLKEAVKRHMRNILSTSKSRS